MESDLAQNHHQTYRNLLFLFSSVFLIFTYNNIFMAILPLFIIDIGGTQFHAGLQNAFFLITAVCLRFLFGPLADLKGNKFTMFIGASAFVIATVLFMFCHQIGQVMLLRLIQAIGLAAYFPSASATVANCAPEGKVGQYLGAFRFVTTASLLIGPSLALNVIDTKGYLYNYFYLTLVALAGLLLIWPIKEHRKAKAGNKPKSKFTEIKKAGWLYLSTFVVAISYGLLFTFTIITLKANTNLINPGLFFTLFSIGGLIANASIGTLSDHWGRPQANLVAMLMLGTGIGLYYFIPVKHWIFYLVGILTGVGYSGSIVVMMAWVTELVSISVRTSALAMQQNGIDLGIAFGAVAYGLVFGIFPNSLAVYGYTGLFLILYGLLVFANRQNFSY